MILKTDSDGTHMIFGEEVRFVAGEFVLVVYRLKTFVDSSFKS